MARGASRSTPGNYPPDGIGIGGTFLMYYFTAFRLWLGTSNKVTLRKNFNNL